MKVDAAKILEQPTTRFLTNQQLDNVIDDPLQMHYPWHNQAVELHVTLATGASLFVVSFERRDRLLRQKIQSCQLKFIYQ